MLDSILIAGLISLLLYWWHSTRCKEIAIAHCQRVCDQAQVQLLDSTVSQQKLWLRRNASNGHIELCRLYTFEYYASNESREYGYLAMLGRQIVDTALATDRRRQ